MALDRGKRANVPTKAGVPLSGRGKMGERGSVPGTNLREGVLPCGLSLDVISCNKRPSRGVVYDKQTLYWGGFVVQRETASVAVLGNFATSFYKHPNLCAELSYYKIPYNATVMRSQLEYIKNLKESP